MNTNLVKRNENGQSVTTSLLVAQKFGKEHYNVIQGIKSLMNSIENSRQLFVSSTYTDASGKENPIYLMNRDGFSLLVMGFTGQKALALSSSLLMPLTSLKNRLS